MLEEKTVEIIGRLYNLILDRNIRDWEREQLHQMKDHLENGKPLNSELREIEIKFRPLALRNNLTPPTKDFYEEISSNKLFGLGTGNFLHSYRGED